MATGAFWGPPALKKRRAGCPAARDQDICLVLQQSNSVWMMAAPGLLVGLEVCPALGCCICCWTAQKTAGRCPQESFAPSFEAHDVGAQPEERIIL